MTNDIAAKPELGKGMYTIPDASLILNLPKEKVRRWIKKYWEIDFVTSAGLKAEYTWGDRRDKAFNFYTLIEIIAIHSFREIGVTFPRIKKARAKLARILETNFPFAHAELISDGKRIFLEHDKTLLELDEEQQFVFYQIVAPYCKKIDFQDKTRLARRFWPLGKDHQIIVDPNHHFGQPVIKGTNISVYTLINMLKAGESPEFVASLYELSDQSIRDTQTFMKRMVA